MYSAIWHMREHDGFIGNLGVSPSHFKVATFPNAVVRNKHFTKHIKTYLNYLELFFNAILKNIKKDTNIIKHY